MTRWIFNVLAGLSLVLRVLSAGLWLRRNYQSDQVIWVSTTLPDARAWTRQRRWELVCAGGGLRLARWVVDARNLRAEAEGAQYRPLPWDNRFRYEASAAEPYPPVMYDTNSPSRAAIVSFMGFGLGRPRRSLPLGGHSQGLVATVPLWAIVAACAVLPLRWELRHRRLDLRSRRLKAGLCPVCGYDLRSHKPGDRCPECGKLIAAGAVQGTT